MTTNPKLVRKLDHIAIVVRDTEDALTFYRDVLGLPVLFSEVVNGGAARLTHLDLGNLHLQLVQPLVESHPGTAFLAEHGEGLHHVCLGVDSVPDAIRDWQSNGLTTPQTTTHQATQGKRAFFLSAKQTRGVAWEVTD
jgi:methylmalonyl-CoA/ethylmalonyl-CoA epimerase